MIRLFTLLIALLTTLPGCGTNSMLRPSSDQTMPSAEANKAQVIFLRPSSYFPEMATLLQEVTPEGDTLIAPIGGENKVIYTTSPGKKLFFSNNGVMAHFLSADLEPGKRYYVLVRPIHGYGFQLRPIRNDGSTDFNTTKPEFKSWISQTVRVESSDTAVQTITRAKSGFDATRAKGFAEWQGKSAVQQAELTLNRADGVSP